MMETPEAEMPLHVSRIVECLQRQNGNQLCHVFSESDQPEFDAVANENEVEERRKLPDAQHRCEVDRDPAQEICWPRTLKLMVTHGRKN